MNRIILFLVLLFSPLIQSEKHILTATGIEFAQWSPMGNHILYTQRHDAKQGLIRMDANGDNDLQLTGDGRYKCINWSPDSSRIAYTRYEVTNHDDDQAAKLTLRVMNADGSQDHTIFETDDYTLCSAWSPDGSKLLVWTNRDLFTLAPDGSNYFLIGSDVQIDSQYTWSPDGQRIAYVGREGTALWVMNADGSGAIHLASRLSLGWIAWVPNGQQISFTYQDEPYLGLKIGVVNASGGGFYDVVDTLDGYPAGFSWSPDSKTLVYANYRDVFRINADGSGEINLTNSPTGELLPLFSPDGSQIAYIALQRVCGDRPEIRVMDVNGANSRPVTFNAEEVSDLAWSPDGAYLTYISTQPMRTSLHAIAAGGGQSELITGDVGSFAVAPNEKKVAFTQGGLQHDDLFTANLDGSGLTRLTENEYIHQYVWSPDGERLALALNQKGLYIVAADAVTVTEDARISTQEIFMSIQWSHDGSLIAYSDNVNIFTIEPISGTLSQLTTGETDKTYMFPQWSPTERTLAFFGTTGTGLALFTYALDGVGLTQLVYVWGETPEYLQWSPDGSKIFYSSSSFEPPLQSTEEANPDTPLPSQPIYFKSYVINADGGGRVFIRDMDYYGRWTPDGRWLQFGAQLISPDGRAEITLGLPLGPYIYSDWSPDSTNILYLTTDGSGVYPGTMIYVARLNLPSPPP